MQDMSTTTSPGWLRRATFYHVLIDRFAGYDPQRDPTQPVYLGGHLAAITARLPYLQDLGVNTLWLSPFYANVSYHGYHITDFAAVDPQFGTEADLRSLIAAVHSRGMRIIADWVPNHCHASHPFFQAAQAGDPVYRPWFYFDEAGRHQGYHGLGCMPRINLDHPPTRTYMIACACHWLEMGLDGFRLDYVVGPSRAFWSAFRAAIRAAFPAAVLIAEVWLGRLRWRDRHTVDLPRKAYRLWQSRSGEIPKDSLQADYAPYFDGILDFQLHELLSEHLAKGSRPAAALPEALRAHYAAYAPDFALPSFLDNHDIDRFMHTCGGDVARFRQAADLQFSLPQPPIIYYGTEWGMTHPEPLRFGQPYADLVARAPMVWTPTPTQADLRAFFQELLARRRRQGLSD
ncbi:MAG: hypothetical protein OHK0039_09500 [Bacteroidia bacterium]